MPKITTFNYRDSNADISVKVFFGARGNSQYKNQFHFKTPEDMLITAGCDKFSDDTLDGLKAQFNSICENHISAAVKSYRVIIVRLAFHRGEVSREFIPEPEYDSFTDIPEKLMTRWRNDSLNSQFGFCVCERQDMSIAGNLKSVYYHLIHRYGILDGEIPDPNKEYPFIHPVKSIRCTYSEYDKRPEDIEIPYTDESFQFLVDVTRGFNLLIDKLYKHLGSEPSLLQSVQSNTKLLNQ